MGIERTFGRHHPPAARRERVASGLEGIRAAEGALQLQDAGVQAALTVVKAFKHHPYGLLAKKGGNAGEPQHSARYETSVAALLRDLDSQQIADDQVLGPHILTPDFSVAQQAVDLRGVNCQLMTHAYVEEYYAQLLAIGPFGRLDDDLQLVNRSSGYFPLLPRTHRSAEIEAETGFLSQVEVTAGLMPGDICLISNGDDARRTHLAPVIGFDTRDAHPILLEVRHDPRKSTTSPTHLMRLDETHPRKGGLRVKRHAMVAAASAAYLQFEPLRQWQKTLPQLRDDAELPDRYRELVDRDLLPQFWLEQWRVHLPIIMETNNISLAVKQGYQLFVDHMMLYWWILQSRGEVTRSNQRQRLYQHLDPDLANKMTALANDYSIFVADVVKYQSKLGEWSWSRKVPANMPAKIYSWLLNELRCQGIDPATYHQLPEIALGMALAYQRYLFHASSA